MEELLVPVLVGFTSLAAYMIGTRALGLSSGGIGQAVGKMLEALGTALVFVMVNLVTGVIGVLAWSLLGFTLLKGLLLRPRRWQPGCGRKAASRTRRLPA